MQDMFKVVVAQHEVRERIALPVFNGGLIAQVIKNHMVPIVFQGTNNVCIEVII